MIFSLRRDYHYHHFENIPKNIWYELYGENNKTNPETCINCSISISNSECFVLLSFFHDLASGAISITTNNIKLLHSECSFNDCKNSYGGSVYVFGQNSVIQHRCCSLYSQASNFGQHSCSYLSYGNFNYFLESCVSSCGQKEKGYETISCRYGIINISYSNISNNNVGYNGAAYGIAPFNSIGKVNFCSICQNHCDYWILMHYSNDLPTYYLINSNILNNSQSSTSYGIISCYRKMTISNCSIFGNFGNGPLIYNNANPLRIENCHIDDLTYYKKTLIHTFNIDSITSYHLFSYFSTNNCLIPFNPRHRETVIKQKVKYKEGKYIIHISIPFFEPLLSIK